MASPQSVRCERRATAQLSVRERNDLLNFAVRRAPGLDPGYLLERLASYEHVWIARRAGRVDAFLLVQEFATSAAMLVYIGPAFSREGAYAFAFAALLGERLRAAEPFLIAMEVENPSVRNMLERLVPGHLFPRADAPPHVAASLRRLAVHALVRVPHVMDFDPESMTSAIPGTARAGEMAARYQVLLVPCSGSLPTRASIARELARGLKGLCVRPAPTSSARERHDG